MPDESEGFVVRDRRRFLSEPETPAAPLAPPTPPTSPALPSPASEAEDEDEGDDTPLDAAQFAAFMQQMAAMQGMQGGLDENDEMQAMQQAGGYPEGGEEDTTLPDIYSVLVMFLNEMRTHALLRLGLVPNPMTGQSEQDLEQARVAIDTLSFLVGQLEPVVAPEERLPIRAMVSDLQMQFARQSQGVQ